MGWFPSSDVCMHRHPPLPPWLAGKASARLGTPTSNFPVVANGTCPILSRINFCSAKLWVTCISVCTAVLVMSCFAPALENREASKWKVHCTLVYKEINQPYFAPTNGRVQYPIAVLSLHEPNPNCSPWL